MPNNSRPIFSASMKLVGAGAFGGGGGGGGGGAEEAESSSADEGNMIDLRQMCCCCSLHFKIFSDGQRGFNENGFAKDCNRVIITIQCL